MHPCVRAFGAFVVFETVRAWFDIIRDMGAANESRHRCSIGLVAAFPPQIGGVPSFAGWLLAHERMLDCRFVTFDLMRPLDGFGGGRVTLPAVALQARNLIRFVPWAARSPRLVHYCVAGNPTGLARDLLFVLVLRCAKRKIVAHVHSGTDLELADRFILYRSALRLISTSSLETVALAPTLVDTLARHGIESTAIFNPAWIDGDFRGPRAMADEKDREPLRLLFVGRYEERKGCHELVHAIAGARGRGADVVLTFVGTEKYPGGEAALRTEVAMLGLVDVVAFRRPLRGRALVEQYDSSDALCLPSYAEGLPMVVLEAMGRGTPVLATRVGGVPDMVIDGETGLLVEPRDRKALEDVIVSVAADRARLRAMGEAARRRIATLASDAVIEGQWRTLYERCARSAMV